MRYKKSFKIIYVARVEYKLFPIWQIWNQAIFTAGSILCNTVSNFLRLTKISIKRFIFTNHLYHGNNCLVWYQTNCIYWVSGCRLWKVIRLWEKEGRIFLIFKIHFHILKTYTFYDISSFLTSQTAVCEVYNPTFFSFVFGS